MRLLLWFLWLHIGGSDTELIAVDDAYEEQS